MEKLVLGILAFLVIGGLGGSVISDSIDESKAQNAVIEMKTNGERLASAMVNKYSQGMKPQEIAEKCSQLLSQQTFETRCQAKQNTEVVVIEMNAWFGTIEQNVKLEETVYLHGSDASVNGKVVRRRTAIGGWTVLQTEDFSKGGLTPSRPQTSE